MVLPYKRGSIEPYINKYKYKILNSSKYCRTYYTYGIVNFMPMNVYLETIEGFQTIIT